MDSPRPRTPLTGLLADVAGAAALGALAAVVVLSPRMVGGGEAGGTVHRIATAILCLACGILWLSLRRARRDLARMDDLLTDVRFGTGTRRDREAVDILVRALRTPDGRARETALRTLRKISGFDLGEDPAAWEQWWAAARNTFVRMASPPVPGKK